MIRPFPAAPAFTAAPDLAVAVPAKDELDALPGCLHALDAAAARYPGRVTVAVVANDCVDGTPDLLRATRLRHARLTWREVDLPPSRRHAGWARRLAFDDAAAVLARPGDLLLSTDADTEVAPDWIAGNARLIAGGADAVAGRALTRRAERVRLGERARRRLDLLTRYYTALDRLRAAVEPPHAEGWPRHYYEGGASIALTLAMYRRIGGAPTPPVAEDRALFAAVREAGGVIRHPVALRVFTSCRTSGRAPGGMADTVAAWVDQDEDTPLHEAYGVDAALSPAEAAPGDRLSFRTLPLALAEAQARIRALPPPPQVEPVLVPEIGRELAHCVAQSGAERLDRPVPAGRVIGGTRPVDEQEVAA